MLNQTPWRREEKIYFQKKFPYFILEKNVKHLSEYKKILILQKKFKN